MEEIIITALTLENVSLYSFRPIIQKVDNAIYSIQ